MASKHVKIGLFGIGLNTYWPQFEGLEQKLQGYLNLVHEKIQRPDVSVVNLGLIDDSEKAVEAGHAFRMADVDLIFLYVTTYAVSSTVLPVIQRAKVPVVVLNLQPEAAIDYASFNAMKDRTRMTGDWLTFCSACPVPEIANIMRRSRIPFHQVTGVLSGDPHVWREVGDWIDAARVAHTMAHNRMGIMGRYYNGMLDICSDLTLQCITFGGHVEVLEIDELAALARDVSEQDVSQRVGDFHEHFDIQADCQPAELIRAARTSVALDRLVDAHRLGSLAYYYESVPGHEHEGIIGSVILGCSLLTGRGIPVAGEYEIKNAQAMKIMDSFGAGGSFTEYYAADFKDDVVLMGHDGPGHVRIAHGRTKVRPLEVFHGKVGSGLSVEMSVQHGPVTLLSVAERDGGLMLLCAEGSSEQGPILEIGNTNSRYRFSLGARKFIESWNAEGPAHHCAVGIGHVADKIKKLGLLLNIPVVQVC